MCLWLRCLLLVIYLWLPWPHHRPQQHLAQPPLATTTLSQTDRLFLYEHFAQFGPVHSATVRAGAARAQHRGRLRFAQRRRRSRALAMRTAVKNGLHCSARWMQPVGHKAPRVTSPMRPPASCLGTQVLVDHSTGRTRGTGAQIDEHTTPAPTRQQGVSRQRLCARARARTCVVGGRSGAPPPS